jgi:hypothetical protein
MNVLLEAPPSEQSVHVAVRMPMPLRHSCHAALRVTQRMALNTICMAHWQAAELPPERAMAVQLARIMASSRPLLHGRRIRVDGHERTEMCSSTVRMCVELCL